MLHFDAVFFNPLSWMTTPLCNPFYSEIYMRSHNLHPSCFPFLSFFALAVPPVDSGHLNKQTRKENEKIEKGKEKSVARGASLSSLNPTRTHSSRGWRRRWRGAPRPPKCLRWDASRKPGPLSGLVFACVHKRRDICQPEYIWAKEKSWESLSLAIVVDLGKKNFFRGMMMAKELKDDLFLG